MKRIWRAAAFIACAAAQAAAAADGLPYASDDFDAVLNSPRKIWAHYVSNQPLQIDAQPVNCPHDYYTRHYLMPGGEGRAHLDNGGWQRVAPLCQTDTPAANFRVNNLAKEFRQMIARGINGVAFNLFSDRDWSVSARGEKGWLFVALEAALQVDPEGRFKVLLMPDMRAGVSPESVPGLLEARVPGTSYTVYTHPAIYRDPEEGGRPQLSPYGADAVPAPAYAAMLARAESEGVPVAWAPVFNELGCSATRAGETCSFASYASLPTSLIGNWASVGTYVDQQRIPAAIAGHLQERGGGPKVRWTHGSRWLAPVAPQFWYIGDANKKGVNPAYEAGGTQAYRNAWTATIAQPLAAQIMIVTWNDNVESSAIQPGRGAFGELRTGFYNLTGYYAYWWRHGAPPAITGDAIVYAHRKMAVSAPAPLVKTSWAFTGSPAGADTIEMLAFVTAPATLEISLGGVVLRSAEAEPGLRRITAMIPDGLGRLGAPQFKILRQGTTVAQATSATVIYGKDGLPAQSIAGLPDGGPCGFSPCWPAGNIDWTYYSGDTFGSSESVR